MTDKREPEEIFLIVLERMMVRVERYFVEDDEDDTERDLSAVVVNRSY